MHPPSRCDLVPLDREQLQAELLARAEQMRRYIARRITGRVPAQIAPDDVLQQVLVAALDGLSSYKGSAPGDLDRWLTGIMDHKLLDVLRDAGRLKRGGHTRHVDALYGGQMPSSDIFTRLAATGRTPSGECRAREAADAIQQALSQLPPDRRTAMRMRYLEGQSRREIARRMRKSESAVKNLLARGLSEVRRWLGSAGAYFSEAALDGGGVKSRPKPQSRDAQDTASGNRP
jgi:RNA polymerase sigma factor (sigma-70 family)